MISIIRTTYLLIGRYYTVPFRANKYLGDAQVCKASCVQFLCSWGLSKLIVHEISPSHASLIKKFTVPTSALPDPGLLAPPEVPSVGSAVQASNLQFVRL